MGQETPRRQGPLQWKQGSVLPDGQRPFRYAEVPEKQMEEKREAARSVTESFHDSIKFKER